MHNDGLVLGGCERTPNIEQPALNNEGKADFWQQGETFLSLFSYLVCTETILLGPTGFDRMSSYGYKHAGAWDARLDH